MQSQMRKLKYHVATTLDGFIAREDDSVDFFPSDISPDHVMDYFHSLLSEYDTVVMGRGTYEPAPKVGITDPYPSLETYVFSRTMKESPDPRVHLVREDPVAFVRELKSRPGTQVDMSRAVRAAKMSVPKDIYLCGGGPLATTLFDAGLIDEVIIKLNPVLLGSGKTLAPHLARKADLELLSTKVYRNGVVLLQYAVKR
ncbi:dihydrofolate reductase family protein [Archangium lansingense]|uniref:Dihydrofolate reductase family protein n=1 Tax=Archangium lansingense TaxID=2995310 RepID=A0ABT4A9J9_9BACT|nr:dihydrofolate reductase family protein [Archangium lansinium]MCY1077944.1 dihydrofolate reductase family protein [Archangium lansinium]